MAQQTQLKMVNGSAVINIQPDDLSAYLAAGYVISGLVYSEGGEGVDADTLILISNGSARTNVKAADVATYLAAGWIIERVLYGDTAQNIEAVKGASLSFLDTPAFSSAEVGTEAATTVVVVFTTEVASADFSDGVTIKINDASQTISAAVRQTDKTTVFYTIPEVVFGDTVTFEYDDDSGSIVSYNDSTPLGDIAAEEVTNNVAEA